MNIRAILAVFRFECKRTMTSGRIVFAALMASFPVAIILVMQAKQAPLDSGAWAGIALFALGPCLLGVMGALMWATPVVTAELEGGTWIYLATRPAGKASVLVGKFLAAAAWTAGLGAAAIAVATLIADPPQMARLLPALVGLCAIAAVTYSAVFAFIGVIASKRATMTAVMYVFILELGSLRMSGAINHLAVQFHLRCLLKEWMDWSFPLEIEMQFFSSVPAAQHLAILAAETIGLLAAAALILRGRELIAAGDVEAA